MAILFTFAELRRGEIAAAAACSDCGVCDVLCPADLSPHAMVAAVKARPPLASLSGPGTRASSAAVSLLPVQSLTHEWLFARLGLIDFDRALSATPTVLSLPSPQV